MHTSTMFMGSNTPSQSPRVKAAGHLPFADSSGVELRVETQLEGPALMIDIIP